MKKQHFRADNAVFEMKTSRHAKLVYLYLCRCADERGYSFPSIANLAWSCSMSETSVHKAMRELAALKVVLIDARQRKNGSQASNAYTIGIVKKGWFSAPDALFDMRVSMLGKLVYLYLCRMANADSSSYPSRKRIAAMCGCGLTTLGRAMRELVEVGLIEKDARFRDNGGQSSNLYVLSQPIEMPRQTTLRVIEGGKKASENVNSLAALHNFYKWIAGLSKCAPLEGQPTLRTLLNRKKDNDVPSNLIPLSRPP